jgi:hypothetical protein
MAVGRFRNRLAHYAIGIPGVALGGNAEALEDCRRRVGAI